MNLIYIQILIMYILIIEDMKISQLIIITFLRGKHQDYNYANIIAKNIHLAESLTIDETIKDTIFFSGSIKWYWSIETS